MALNISPGDDAVAQDEVNTIDVKDQSAETATALDEQSAAEGDANSAHEGASEAPVADAAEQSPEAPATQPEEGQDVAEATQENAPVEQPTPSASGEAAPASDDDAHDLIDKLEYLIGRAHHFENAGIEKLRASGLALIERLRNAI